MPLPLCISSTLFNCMLTGLFWDLLAAQKVFNKKEWVADKNAGGPSSQVAFFSLSLSCPFTSSAAYFPLSFGGGTKASLSKRFPHMACICFVILRSTHSVSGCRFSSF